MSTELEATFRLQLKRILDSPEFASSPQIRQFLGYVSEAAFQNRLNLDQIDIAEHVLAKQKDFNPVEDASVRRIATVTRRKIQQYYEGSGRTDPVLITLPQRGYVPVFRFRENIPSGVASSPVRAAREHLLLAWGVGAIALSMAAAYLARHVVVSRQLVTHPATVEIVTQRGTIEDKVLNLPGNGILLGPQVGPNDDVSVAMQFTPEQAYQQAGIIIFQNPDHYIKLGRRFHGRVSWEFGAEEHGQYNHLPGIWRYDPLGQNGRPAWLLIRRRQNLFRGFTSEDGHTWTQMGNELTTSEPMTGARVGVYAYNGDTEAARIHASFQQLGLGLTFGTALSPESEFAPLPDWGISSDCPESSSANLMADALKFSFSPKPCIWQLVRPAPPGDFVVTTKLDVVPFSGTVAGLILTGRNGRIRLARWPLNGSSIVLQYPPGDQIRVQPDFAGYPPVVLRLDVKGGRVTGSFSRDDVDFKAVPGMAKLGDLGGDLRFGITAQSTSWNQADVAPTARFYYVRQPVVTLENFR